MQSSFFTQNWQWWKVGEQYRHQVELPHDAMLYERRRPLLKEGSASGYFPGGSYIYEKRFHADPEWRDRAVMLEFEGVYQKSTVTLNGQRLGGWIYGYTNFYIDLTGHLNFSDENILRVEVNNSQTPNSRWYTGSGIYRPVHILVGDRQHILPNGIKITTKAYAPAIVSVEAKTTALDVETEVDIRIIKDGSLIAEAKGTQAEFCIPDAKLWSAESPSLYEAEVSLISGGIVIDSMKERFGIRKLEWSAKTGLLCNGKALKLRGGCIHHDNGPLGACEFEAAAYRRVRILKQAGFNAIRSSHNPISKALLRACDELGMYILDETFDVWLTAKNEYDYSLYFGTEHAGDIRAMIEKDYNHPSVILYSIGNEIGDITAVYGQELHRQLVELCHRLDPTRPVTNSVNIMSAMSRPQRKRRPIPKRSANDIVDPCREVSADKATGSKLINNIVTFFPMLIASVTPKMAKNNLRAVMDGEDIVGFNYGDHLMESLHNIDPDRILLNTETFPKSIGKNWPVILRNTHCVGDFMWTGWDYLGEAGIGVVLYGKQPKQFNKPYPCIAAGIGSVDLIGTIESQGYYAAVVWGAYTKPYIGVRPLNHAGEKAQFGQWRGTDSVSCWSWPGYEGTKAEIEVFSQGQELELLQNGRSLGRHALENCKAVFETVYVPGTLTAISYDTSGEEISRSELKTAGEKSFLCVIPDKTVLRADGQDLVFLNISVSDEDGIVKDPGDLRAEVKVTGAGTLQAIGSGNPWTEDSYLGSSFSLYHGRALAIVRSSHTEGNICVTVSVSGFDEQDVLLRAENA